MPLLGEGAEELAREFMEHRLRLLGIAYRLLGTMWDAEDIVSDAMVRWGASIGNKCRSRRPRQCHIGRKAAVL